MKGSCHCRAVQFEALGDPYWTGACYCVDCRKASGAPYLAFAGFDEVKFTHGTPKEYASSEKMVRTFCDTCGTAISFAYKEHPDKLFLCVGLFDEPEKLAPQEHIFIEQKLPWIQI